MANIIYYGAGENASINFDKFIKKTSEPSCFVDADTCKHYTEFNQGKYIILPLNIAINKYPDYELWLTPTLDKLSSITKYLLDLGIPKEKIKYFQDVEYRYGCAHLGKLLVVHTDGIRPCCNVKGKFIKYDEKILTEQSLPRYILKYNQWLDDTLNRLRVGKPTDCDGCSELLLEMWPKKPKIEWLNAGARFADTLCNCRCVYCLQRDTAFSNKSIQLLNAYDIHRILYDIYGNAIIGTDLVDGEITVISYRDKLLDLIISNGWNASIATNAIVYNEKIAKIMQRPRSRLSVSLDCGTVETYKRIKGVNAFNKVVNNLNKYALRNAKIDLKYILLPGFNDNLKDVAGFVEIAKKINVFRVTISNDLLNGAGNPNRKSEQDIPNSEIEILKQLVKLCKEKNIVVTISPGCFTKADCKRLLNIIKNDSTASAQSRS